MGVYPCKHCGARFISVNMTQEAHHPSCPYITIERYRVALEAIERHTREHSREQTGRGTFDPEGGREGR
jgi:hypothetical protein